MLKTIGAITFDSSQVIGKGSSSVVYKGTLGQREIAVKKVEKKLSRLVQREMTQLQMSDGHPNVIRYFLTEEDSDFYYIALELAYCTLREYVSGSVLKSKIPPKKIVADMIEGMKWLHEMSVVHRDIKPTNVLLLKNKVGELEVKISDFGFAKQLEVSDSQMSIAPDGSKYWTVPEMARGRYNLKSDVYSMGCLVFYVMSEGNVSIANEVVNFTWSANSDSTSEGNLVKHLVQSMTMQAPEQRPSFKCLLFHPFFWDSTKTLSFINAVADRVKVGDYQAIQTKSSIQGGCEAVFGDNWETRLEQDVINSLAYRSARHNYGTSSASELLRAIRNKAAHYDEMSYSAKSTYGSMPGGFSDYWTRKFPSLIRHLYVKVAMSGLRSDKNFEAFYPPQEMCNNNI